MSAQDLLPATPEAGVVALVVVGGGLNGDRVEPGGAGLEVPQSRRGDHPVEHSDDLGTASRTTHRLAVPPSSRARHRASRFS